MQVISALCGWLFFIAFIALIVGLIKPRLVVRWGNVKTRRRVGLIYGVTALIAVIIGASAQPSTPATVPPSTNNSMTATGPGPSSNATSSSKNTTSTNNTPSSTGSSSPTNVSTSKSNGTSNSSKPAPPPTPTQPMVYSLAMTPDQFRQNFNAAASQDGSDLSITSLSVDNSGVQGTFKYMFTDSLGIVGSVNRDGSLRDVMLIGQGDGTFQSGANIIIGIGLLIQATNPNMPADQRGQIVRNLGLTDKNVDMTNLDKSTTYNGFKYMLSSSSYTGLMFSVGNANDN